MKGTLYRLCMEPLGWQNTGGHSDLAADGCEALFRHLSHHLPRPLLGHSLSEALVENPCCLSGPLHSPSWALQSWQVSASSSHPATDFCLGSACLGWHIAALHSVNAWKENSSLFCDSLFSDTASLSDPSCPGSSNANSHLPAQSEGCHLELRFQQICISAPDPANTLSTGAVSVEFSSVNLPFLWQLDLQVLCCLTSSNHFFLNTRIFYPNLRVDLSGRVFHTLYRGVNGKCCCQAKDAAAVKPSSRYSCPEGKAWGHSGWR